LVTVTALPPSLEDVVDAIAQGDDAGAGQAGAGGGGEYGGMTGRIFEDDSAGVADRTAGREGAAVLDLDRAGVGSSAGAVRGREIILLKADMFVDAKDRISRKLDAVHCLVAGRRL
jgi:hypothetical protein